MMTQDELDFIVSLTALQPFDPANYGINNKTVADASHRLGWTTERGEKIKDTLLASGVFYKIERGSIFASAEAQEIGVNELNRRNKLREVVDSAAAKRAKLVERVFGFASTVAATVVGLFFYKWIMQ